MALVALIVVVLMVVVLLMVAVIHMVAVAMMIAVINNASICLIGQWGGLCPLPIIIRAHPFGGGQAETDQVSAETTTKM